MVLTRGAKRRSLDDNGESSADELPRKKRFVGPNDKRRLKGLQRKAFRNRHLQVNQNLLSFTNDEVSSTSEPSFKAVFVRVTHRDEFTMFRVTCEEARRKMIIRRTGKGSNYCTSSPFMSPDPKNRCNGQILNKKPLDLTKSPSKKKTKHVNNKIETNNENLNKINENDSDNDSEEFDLRKVKEEPFDDDYECNNSISEDDINEKEKVQLINCKYINESNTIYDLEDYPLKDLQIPCKDVERNRVSDDLEMPSLDVIDNENKIVENDQQHTDCLREKQSINSITEQQQSIEKQQQSIDEQQCLDTSEEKQFEDAVETVRDSEIDTDKFEENLSSSRLIIPDSLTSDFVENSNSYDVPNTDDKKIENVCKTDKYNDDSEKSFSQLNNIDSASSKLDCCEDNDIIQQDDNNNNAVIASPKKLKSDNLQENTASTLFPMDSFSDDGGDESCHELDALIDELDQDCCEDENNYNNVHNQDLNKISIDEHNEHYDTLNKSHIDDNETLFNSIKSDNLSKNVIIEDKNHFVSLQSTLNETISVENETHYDTIHNVNLNDNNIEADQNHYDNLNKSNNLVEDEIHYNITDNDNLCSANSSAEEKILFSRVQENLNQTKTHFDTVHQLSEDNVNVVDKDNYSEDNNLGDNNSVEEDKSHYGSLNKNNVNSVNEKLDETKHNFNDKSIQDDTMCNTEIEDKCRKIDETKTEDETKTILDEHEESLSASLLDDLEEMYKTIGHDVETNSTNITQGLCYIMEDELHQDHFNSEQTQDLAPIEERNKKLTEELKNFEPTEIKPTITSTIVPTPLNLVIEEKKEVSPVICLKDENLTENFPKSEKKVEKSHENLQIKNSIIELNSKFKLPQGTTIGTKSNSDKQIELRKRYLERILNEQNNVSITLEEPVVKQNEPLNLGLKKEKNERINNFFNSNQFNSINKVAEKQQLSITPIKNSKNDFSPEQSCVKINPTTSQAVIENSFNLKKALEALPSKEKKIEYNAMTSFINAHLTPNKVFKNEISKEKKPSTNSSDYYYKPHTYFSDLHSSQVKSSQSQNKRTADSGQTSSKKISEKGPKLSVDLSHIINDPSIPNPLCLWKQRVNGFINHPYSEIRNVIDDTRRVSEKQTVSHYPFPTPNKESNYYQNQINPKQTQVQKDLTKLKNYNREVLNSSELSPPFQPYDWNVFHDLMQRPEITFNNSLHQHHPMSLGMIPNCPPTPDPTPSPTASISPKIPINYASQSSQNGMIFSHSVPNYHTAVTHLPSTSSSSYFSKTLLNNHLMDKRSSISHSNHSSTHVKSESSKPIPRLKVKDKEHLIDPNLKFTTNFLKNENSHPLWQPFSSISSSSTSSSMKDNSKKPSLCSWTTPIINGRH